MNEPIKITVHPPPDPPTQVLQAALLMACRNCRATMVRGTQCRRCGAWCR